MSASGVPPILTQYATVLGGGKQQFWQHQNHVEKMIAHADREPCFYRCSCSIRSIKSTLSAAVLCARPSARRLDVRDEAQLP
jgi:hypothetical protein